MEPVQERLIQVSECLYQFRDTCHVYLVKFGQRGILIDFGSGEILDRLSELGIERIEAILMTHHHRDQGQGLHHAEAQGIPIFVPHMESDLFARVDEHWQAREIDNNYNVREDRFSLIDPVGIAGTMKDYTEMAFGPFKFRILPTPGHTPGSVTLLSRIDGLLAAFTGDLIAAPGQLWSLAATQWTYNGAEGIPAGIASLLDLKEKTPDLLLPSHGRIMMEPLEAIDALVEICRMLLQERKQNPRLFELRERPYEEIVPGLLKCRVSFANHYVLLSSGGKALFIDFGYDFFTGHTAGYDRASRRPWLYTLPALKRQYGVRSIDAVMLTHYHDDHVAGCNLLRDVEGAQVWAAENFADILEQPHRYDLPCLWYDPVPVDRVLPFHRAVKWEEFEFTLYPQPGHARYAAAIFFRAGEKKVLVIGDQHVGEDGMGWNYVYANRLAADDYRASGELYAKLRPDVILSGHSEPFWPQDTDFELYRQRGRLLQELHQDLLFGRSKASGTADDGTGGIPEEGFVARIMPYRMDEAAGSIVTVRLELTNPFARPETALVRWVLPDGWEVDRHDFRIALAPHEIVTVPYNIAISRKAHGRRNRIAADVTIGKTRYGQQAEALITIQ